MLEGTQMNAVAIIEPEPVSLPPSGSLSLALPKGLAFEQWQAIGRELAAREKVLNWWIGDWWAFGEHRYGERAKALADGLFGKAFQTIANAGTVSRSLETSRRREALSWSHHAEVAPLARQSGEAAQMLLDRAERESMTVAQVRAAVRVLQGKTAAEVLTARDEDPDHYEVLAIARAWNRAQLRNRAAFMELVGEAGLRDIDP
jgi:hypothetical protein